MRTLMLGLVLVGCGGHGGATVDASSDASGDASLDARTFIMPLMAYVGGFEINTAPGEIGELANGLTLPAFVGFVQLD